MLPDSLPMKASRLSGIAEENFLENCHQKPSNVLEFEVLPLVWTLAVMNMAHRITDDFGVRHVTVCSVLHRTFPHDFNRAIDTFNNMID